MKKQTIIRLNESQLNNALKNTIQEVKDSNKQVINENWFVDMSVQMGDFIYTHFPVLFKQILSMSDQWKDAASNSSAYDWNDPTILQKAKQVVGSIVSVPAGVTSFFAGTGGAVALLNKYGDKIEQIKSAFFKQFAKS
jgi:hypothetical protein